jgi:hypothetical protein
MEESIMGSDNIKGNHVRRVLLAQDQAVLIAGLLKKLRDDYCKVDTSKLVNEILTIFFSKYFSNEYGAVKDKFFNKKSYLKGLIQSSEIEDLDQSIKEYLGQASKRKRRKKKQTNEAHEAL